MIFVYYLNITWLLRFVIILFSNFAAFNSEMIVIYEVQYKSNSCGYSP